MPVFLLNDDEEAFPPVELSESNGLLAVGGTLSPKRLVAGYQRGIFPWYSKGQPILWHSPDPRFVLVPEQIHIGRSLRKAMNRKVYEIRLDTAFEQVISGCADTPRPGQDGTWLTDEMRAAYTELHRLGLAHSAEAWENGRLMGGLYGVALGSVFFGESMFAWSPDASKVAFATLVEQLVAWGYTLVDCQMETDHLARFGAEAWERTSFLAALKEGLKAPNRAGKWTLEMSPLPR